MAGQLVPSLSAKNGHTLELLAPVRVSDPDKQDELSLEDQQELIASWVKRNTDLRHLFTVIRGTGSGELLTREEYLHLIDEVSTGRYDAVICEDLGRIVRRLHAHLFCEHCVDHNTRVIAINDHVDTAQPGWQDASFFAAWHHERSNRDTSERIKRTHRSRFMMGGIVRPPIYGYLKPEGTKTDADLKKDPASKEIYEHWFGMLDTEATFAEVASWLKDQKVPLAPLPRRKGPPIIREWTGKIVARITFNPLLKGVRERNHRKTQRGGDGKYRPVAADPSELLQRRVPHLAFFEEEYYDRVINKLRQRNAKYRRSADPRKDPRRNVPKKRSRFPGQVIFCGICGHLYVYGGHGQKDHLMCTGAREHRCWNGVTVDGPLAARKIAAAVLEAIEHLPEFDEQLLALVKEEAQRMDEAREQERKTATNKLEETRAAIANIMAYIRSQGDRAGASISEELAQLEEQKAASQTRLAELTRPTTDGVSLPPVEEIKQMARKIFGSLAIESDEFARQMRRIVPRIVVFPHRLCDGNGLVLRAKFQLQIGNLLQDPQAQETLRAPLSPLVPVDLFDPPQREAHRRQILADRETMNERQAASKAGITVTAAQRAAALQRKMDVLGITDPYVPVTEPPDNCSRLRRHRHRDYRFTPRADAGHL